MRYKFICEYNGFGFCGWQIQKKTPIGMLDKSGISPTQVLSEGALQDINGEICKKNEVYDKVKTVQGELERAFEIALRQKINITGAGRTDSGVHSRGLVAHFDFDGDLNLAERGKKAKKGSDEAADGRPCNGGLRTLERSINALTCKDARIRGLERCADDFHARYSAKERYYTYTLCSSPIVLGQDYVWECGRYNLDFELMRKEAESFLGKRDFNAFSIPRNDGKSTECEIFEFRGEVCGNAAGLALNETAGANGSLVFRWHIRGNRFLHRMVRSMVGLLFDIGRGRYGLGTVGKVFSGEFKGERVWAPPQGLVLEAVGY